ncbi:hemerythrin domain-containing protein [Oceanibium sediminis]|uniref:hemerythrin domain-containing protein n=1 Tax=Oceanibium sediminis TaxID=2026339 RepID=UPI000DD4662C|nr:hemerythrin domain-containing protein [Oceanibium sediminis]
MEHPNSARRGSGLCPTDLELLASPLDFLSEDHLRERQICTIIEQLAAADALDRPLALTVLRFLNEELNVHMRDEAEDLFPLLSRRCTDEDSIDSAISRIRAEQDEAMCLLPETRLALAASLDTGADLTAAGRAVLSRFARRVRRHLVAENAILLPIARARLTPADQRKLSAQMRSRRGLPPFRETSNAE